jgi:imidazolonepropionase-like amidohydrolase
MIIGNRPAYPRGLGEVDGIGIVTAGKEANMVVIDRNLAENIATTRKVKLVFKDAAGYDPAKLDSVEGTAGLH